MKKLGFLIIIFILGSLSFAETVSAHRSGCHRWHSCPSDTGSYVCGDLGYTTYCGDSSPNQFLPPPSFTPPPTPKPTPPPSIESNSFVGRPKSYTNLYNCKVVGNYNSKIYHLKGSKHIKKMNLKNKECFATELDAIKKGFRKSKT